MDFLSWKKYSEKPIKILFTCIFCAGLSPILFAQPLSYTLDDELPESKVAWGLRAGVSLASMGNGQPYLQSRTGFYIGGILEYSPSNWVSILLRPGYNQLGGHLTRFEDESRFFSKISQQNSFEEFEGPIVLEEEQEHRVFVTTSNIISNSLELPLSARFGYDLEKMRLFVSTGVSASYQVWVSEKFERTHYFDQVFLTSTGTELVTHDFEPFQVGLIGGIGVLFNIGSKNRMAFEINYQYGLTPLKKSFSYLGIPSIRRDLYADSILIGIELMF